MTMTPSRKAVILDCDGTLVDVTGIRHYVVLEHPDSPGYRDYERFHKASAWCPPIKDVVAEATNWWLMGYEVLVVTARKERWRSLTKAWLDQHRIHHSKLYMRGDDDNRPDAAVKADILQKIRSEGYQVVHAYDDNPSIVKLWKMEGILTTEVPGWMG